MILDSAALATVSKMSHRGLQTLRRGNLIDLINFKNNIIGSVESFLDTPDYIIY